MQREEDRDAAILDRRTVALANRGALAEAEAASGRRPVILAGVGSSLFAFDLAEVAAVIPFAGCARMPVREPAVLGVIGRAGRFYSVVGMRLWLGLAAGSGAAGSGQGAGPHAEPGGDPAAAPAHLLLLRGAPHLALGVDRVLGRFDLEGESSTLTFDHRLVAVFDVAGFRSRLGSPAGTAINR